MKIFGMLSILVLLTACGGKDEAKWTEEVKLHDGRIVQVQRRATRGSSDFPNPGRGALGENELIYSPAGARWRNEPRSADWILSFDIINNIPHLVIRGAGGRYCQSHGPNSFDITLLKWIDGGWLRVPEEQFPLSVVTQNVSMRYWGQTVDEDTSGVLSFQRKISKDDYENGEPELLLKYLNRRHMRCGQTLPYLFKDK